MNFAFNRDKRRHAARLPTTPTTISSTSVSMRRQSSPDDSNWETLGLSSTDYARRRKELMQLINDLRSLGAETMMDLPSIVVIGGQSAGKSSLVEAVSGVNVPRDSGTCTRCPMECTMSSSVTTWSCTIKLRFDYDSSGKSIAQQKVLSFGPTITDRDEVEIWLRRAQAAILNPNLPPESFHGRSVEDLRNNTSSNTLKFSRNVVSIFIEDPSATDLSFVDLPGLIHNEDEEVLDLVRELTESYISRPNTIILTTIPMTDDMRNQQSVKLARQVDPDGERTIGILTKPDMLGDGAVDSRQNWVEVIEGRQHVLRHGYYCVRLPDDAQRAQRLSRSAFQHMASEYFDTASPWSEITNRGRFGVPAFVTDISVLLVRHINKVIPQLVEDVERLLDDCLAEISTLPKPLEVDPQVEVLARVNAFCDAFKGAVSGTSSDKTLAQRNRELYTIFAQGIRGTSPDFRPFEDPTQYMPIDELNSRACIEVRNEKVQAMGVYDVRKTIQDSIAWELPGNIPYEAKIRLINQFTKLWSLPARKCLTSINGVLDDVVQQLAKKHFGRFSILQDMVSDLIRPDLEEYKSKTLTAVEDTLKLEITPIYSQNLEDFRDLRERWLIKYRKARRHPGEYRKPKPLAERIPEPPTVEWDQPVPICEPMPMPMAVPSVKVSPGKNRRNPCSEQAFDGDHSPETHALKYLAQAGYRDITVNDLVHLLPGDQFEDELVVMAEVRAYFTVAYKRIIDHVPLKIHQSLHQALADRLSFSLLHRLVDDTNSTGSFADRMKELVREDPATEAKQIRLEATRTRLQEMKRTLVNFAA